MIALENWFKSVVLEMHLTKRNTQQLQEQDHQYMYIQIAVEEF